MTTFDPLYLLFALPVVALLVVGGVADVVLKALEHWERKGE